MSVKSEYGTNKNLIILLPSFGGEGAHYKESGLIKTFRDKGGEAHLKILDVKPSLYLGSKIIDLLKTEVITPAKKAGYEKIYLVGVSMGGHGALLYTTNYPEEIEGTVVFAPFLSGPRMRSSIEKVGGIEKFEKCPFIGWDYACNMWLMLKDYISSPKNKRRLILCYGTEDEFAKQNRILADMLPPVLVLTVPGGHDWKTWKKLWIKVRNYITARGAGQRATDTDSPIFFQEDEFSIYSSEQGKLLLHDDGFKFGELASTFF
jgi:hypothetical protein